MTDVDPFATQRDTSGSVVAELAAAGFDDAEEIGRGGFGAVYRCVQPELDRTVAVKVLTAHLDENNRARFLREQLATGRLTGHPNIVTVLQVGTTDTGRPFIVMPYYPHGSLDTRIRHHGPLALQDALRLGVKIAGALETAHRFGILHRDIKPGNILFTDYSEPVLTDFGIAHITGGFVTGTGLLTGTPSFTAPEVVAGELPSPAADVYGLGSTLFAAITGHAAFERRSGEQLIAQFLRITAEPVPDPRDHGIPEDVSTTIEHAMSTNPANRPSPAELGEQLQKSQGRHGYPVDEIALRAPPPAEQAGTSHLRARSASTDRASYESRPSSKPSDSARTGMLPAELTSFVGRRTELAEATNLLSTSRMVSLTGIGGVGKTRLAVRVATKAQRHFSHGVTFVDLGELRDESLLLGVVARALGLQDRSARPLHEALIEYLTPRESLLVLDNCEQLVTAIAQLAESLLRVCPRLRILATSREPIGISGEAVLPIPPLAVPDPDRLPRGLPRNDAMQLFAERAAAAVAGFELTEDNKPTIARICQRLDGLPLAIELATARLRAMAPEQILQRLTDRFALLNRASRTAPSRQQTLRMCIDWSYDLCTPEEQRAWVQLSVFAGTFEIEAAQHICGDDISAQDLLDTVTDLVDKSILIREESGSTVRFGMLETIRTYGLMRAEQTGEYPELRRRHRDWYERLALDVEADWISPRQLDWITRLNRALPNFRQALEVSVANYPEAGIRIADALFPYWLSQGLITEGRHWIDLLLARATGQVTAEQARAVYAGTHMAVLQGDIDTATALVGHGRALIEQTTDLSARPYVDLAEGLLLLCRGNPSDARPLLENALAVYDKRAELLPHVFALMLLGLTHELLGHADRSIEYNERGLAIVTAQGDRLYSSYIQWTLGIAVWQRGDRAQATHLLEEALRISRRVTDPITGAMCIQALAWIAADDDDVTRAAVLSAAAEQINMSMGSPALFLPNLQIYQEQSERRIRQAMSERAVTAARRKGAALSFDAAIAYSLGEDIPPTSISTAAHKVTQREREVAGLIADGLTNNKIATRLVISSRTVEKHVAHLLTKLDFSSRAQIAAWAASQRGQPSGKGAAARGS